MHPLYQNNYVPIPNFISKEEALELHEYMKRTPDRMGGSGDSQVPNTPAYRNELPLVRLLVKKVPQLSEILGEELLPTYVYGRIYKHGDVLERHRDRPSCEISITLNLFQDCDWPIWFEKPNNQEVSVSLSPGDATMYLGCVADHWRNKFEGNIYTQIFLHYVKAYGRHADNFFDRYRPA